MTGPVNPHGVASSMTDKTHRLLEDSTGAPPAHSEIESGGVSVTASGQLAALGAGARSMLVHDGVPAGLNNGDPTLWGPEAEPEAKIRLGWLTSPQTSRALLPQLAELKERTSKLGLDHIVLAGM